MISVTIHCNETIEGDEAEVVQLLTLFAKEHTTDEGDES